MSSTQKATITSLQICVGHREPMRSVEIAKVITGFGIEGDRHATSEGVRVARQALLIDEETLHPLGLSSGDVRENITTTGIDVHSLPEGQHVALGDEVVLKITGHCAPCPRMDEIRSGLQDILRGQRGMLSQVVYGGTIKVGDVVRVLESAPAS